MTSRSVSLKMLRQENERLRAELEQLRAPASPPAEPREHVAWRWRPRGATVWHYNPDEAWLSEQGDAVEKEPLYLYPSPAAPQEPLAWLVKFIGSPSDGTIEREAWRADYWRKRPTEATVTPLYDGSLIEQQAREIARLNCEVESWRRYNANIDEALNSGNGSYRP